MLFNIRKKYLNPLIYRSQKQQSSPSRTEPRMDDPVAQRHWDATTPETAYVPGCTCNFSSNHPEADVDAHSGRASMRSRSASCAHHSLPSTRSIVQVLYPPSYLGTPRSFPDPPAYSSSDSLRPARGGDAESFPLISSTAISVEGASLSHTPPDPLAQDPSLTGIPSQETPLNRIPPLEPNFPVVASGGDVSEEGEPLPAYSHFDQRRSRFPVAPSVLGPYPPLSVLCQAAR